MGDQEESKEGSTAQQIRFARKMSKIAKLSEVLRRNTSIASGEDNQDREYRLLTAGEDGMIFWWSFKAPYIEDISAIEQGEDINPITMFVRVNPTKIATLQSIH